ncbi:MAG: lipocalin family protein [Maritimibacter sp.]
MTRFLCALLLVWLAACAPAPTDTDTDTDMRSIVSFDQARFAGEWREVQSGALWRVAPNMTEISYPGGIGAAKLIGPGRIQVQGRRAPLWVLWVDEGYRTVVIGTPDRSFSLILNRGDIAPDRLRAAREILDWNGYDLGSGR